MTQPPEIPQQPYYAPHSSWATQGSQVSGQPPRNSRKTWKILLAVAIVVALLCCGAGIFIVRSLASTFGEGLRPVRESAAAFMDDVVRDDTAAAYGKFCSDGKERYTEQQFADRLHTYRAVSSYEIDGVVVNNINGTTRGRVTVQLVDATGSHQVQLDMVKDDDRWAVCGDPF